jgi:hypothetical protein
MNVRYPDELSETERAELTALLSGGKHAARKLKQAQILLAADAGAGDEEIARSVGVGGSTVYRTKCQFVLGNLEAAEMWCIPKVDGEYVFLDVSWRRVKVADSCAAVDFAACMRELADVHFPKAERIRVVLDNLSTHSAGALYQAFPAEARRVLRRLEFHYVPKHASWLNMVEIEIGVSRGQCLDRRIATQEQLVSEIAAWEQQRNASGARIKWMFTTAKARAKMGRAYPDPAALRQPRAKKS